MAEKKTETAKAATVKETTEKAAEAVKETAEKVANVAKTEAKAVKGAARKTAAKTKTAAQNAAAKTKTAAKNTATKAAKKVEESKKQTIYVQFAGKEIDVDEIASLAKADFKANNSGYVKKLDVYVKPEDSAAYYVVNGKTTGKVEL